MPDLQQYIEVLSSSYERVINSSLESEAAADAHAQRVKSRSIGVAAVWVALRGLYE